MPSTLSLYSEVGSVASGERDVSQLSVLHTAQSPSGLQLSLSTQPVPAAQCRHERFQSDGEYS
jgi:hypothetical protein